MPKEITHWLIAEKAAERLTDRTKSSILMRYIGMVRLGAIIHDVLYYVRSGSANIRRCSDIANALHGTNGEDTFALLRIIASGIDTPNTDSLQHREAFTAFLFGATTHYCADVIFHPYIYYVSGNCLKNQTSFQAWEHHRSLEAAIDLTFCKTYHRRVHEFSLLNDISLHRLELQSILQHVAQTQYNAGMNIRAKDYEEGYKTLAWLRLLMRAFVPNAFLDTIEYAVPSLVRTIISAETRSYLGLRYTRQSRWGIPASRHPFQYYHPVSGEHYTTTLADLFEQAVQETITLWGMFEHTIIAGRLLETSGKSLEVGLPGIPNTAMKTFAEISVP